MTRITQEIEILIHDYYLPLAGLFTFSSSQILFSDVGLSVSNLCSANIFLAADMMARLPSSLRCSAAARFCSASSAYFLGRGMILYCGCRTLSPSLCIL